MGWQKELFEHFNAFSENKISEKVLFNTLSDLLPSVWRHGLSTGNFDVCLRTLVNNKNLNKDTRKYILQCMVPRKKLPRRSVNVLLLWFFSNVYRPYDASLALHWLSVMISHNLIDEESVGIMIDQLLMCLFIDDLTGPVCDVLKTVIKPGLVSLRSVFIVQNYCDSQIKLKDHAKVLYLQRLIYECSPSLFTNSPTRARPYKESKDKFSESVAQFAFQNKFLKALPVHLMPNSKKDSGSNNTSSRFIASNSFKEINGMKDLALQMRSKNISISDINSALGSKEGLMYLCWHHAMGWGFPKEVFTSLETVEKLLDVCRRVKSGLNFIPAMMPGFLLSWDGEENHEIIYELISWMHFETFEDLYKNVLFYIVNLYVTGIVRDKVNILYSLTKLIANKVTALPREVTVLLIALVGKLIKIGLCGTALQSSVLLMASVRFYKYLSFIEERYMLGTWTIAPPFVVFGALFSECFVLISEICSLVVRYNTVMLDKFTSLGLMDKFEEEEEIIKTYLKDLYLFLWEGQASKTELMASEVNESLISNLAAEFDSVLTVRNHSGIAPLVSFLALQFDRDPKALADEDLIKVLTSYCEGVVLLKQTVLPAEEDSQMEID
ncbi:centromere protein I [Halyomorpha halys]|uniref:centromere protein I n=1 Tax=Halyomorpha halys TaxID=286706 RepID=UPI0006D5086C|nr:centromere protein I-like [Halyomorpha halys]